MRLVDRHQQQPAALVQTLELSEHAPSREAYLGDVHDRHPLRQPHLVVRDVLVVHRHRPLARIARPPRLVVHQPHLVVHQRDVGRDHDDHLARVQRGQLVAEALARVGRPHDERIAPLQHRLDDLTLQAAELGDAKLLAQRPLERLLRHRWQGRCRRGCIGLLALLR